MILGKHHFTISGKNLFVKNSLRPHLDLKTEDPYLVRFLPTWDQRHPGPRYHLRHYEFFPNTLFPNKFSQKLIPKQKFFFKKNEIISQIFIYLKDLIKKVTLSK